VGAVVVAGYYATASLGLELSVAHGVITPVWPPAGIALASLLLLGPRLWPAVTIGAFLSNVTHDASPAVAAAIAAGNTLEALVGYALLRRTGFRLGLDRARDVLALTVLAGFVSTAIAATVGVTALAVAGAPAASPFGSAWALWFLGDAMGVLLVTPVILVWAVRPGRWPTRERALEAVVLLVLLAGTSAAVFLGGLWRYPYPLFPLLVWATLRFHQRGAATGSFVVASMAVAGAVSGQSPLGENATTAVQILQGLLAFVAVSLLALGATLSERDEADLALRRTADSLAEAQELASIGSWEWDFASDQATWSRALFRIFGLAPTPEGAPPSRDAFFALVHPRDRERLRETIEFAVRECRPFDLTYSIVLADGTERVIQARGIVDVAETGKPRIIGTAQDVTERHRLQTLRENILAAVSHELRTPLTSILGFALTLQERGPTLDEATATQIVDELVKQSLRLERLLSDLLDIDRLRDGRLQAALAPANVTELARQAAAAVELRDGTTVEVHGDELVAVVDASKLERVLENLVANAVKHTPEGTTVSVTIAVDPRGLLIGVDDDGPGIPDPQKQEIFDLFARAADPNTPGTGVGLALAAQFVALQGGRVWVEDNPGGGAAFRVLLPTAAVEHGARTR
jgi:signal transduction histidine kinase